MIYIQTFKHCPLKFWGGKELQQVIDIPSPLAGAVTWRCGSCLPLEITICLEQLYVFTNLLYILLYRLCSESPGYIQKF